MNKSVCPSVLFACISTLLSANSQATPLGAGLDLDLQLAGVSDYRFHGISQTLGDPALQGGATVSSSTGAYASIWGSNVDFGGGIKTRFEQDYYLGWLIPISDEISLDIGYLKYAYTKSADLNQSVWYGTVKYSGIELSYQYSSDMFGNQVNDYASLAYTYSFSTDTRMNVRYGLSDYKDDIITSKHDNSRSTYSDWEIRLEKDYIGATWAVSYIDTNLSKSECTSFSGYDDLCSATLMAAATKHF